MKPVMQTVFGKGGNCMSACLASMFDLPIEQVPNFFDVAGFEPEAWNAAVREWLAQRGYGILSISITDEHRPLARGYMLASGPSPRFEGLYHQIILKDGELFHDPHPDKTFVTKVDCLDILYPLNPAEATRP